MSLCSLDLGTISSALQLSLFVVKASGNKEMQKACFFFARDLNVLGYP